MAGIRYKLYLICALGESVRRTELIEEIARDYEAVTGTVAGIPVGEIMATRGTTSLGAGRSDCGDDDYALFDD